MCGIVGFLSVSSEAPPSFPREALASATESIKSRGPDDGDIWISESNQIGFGHRRLSVIDISSRGRQPMRDAVGNSLTYNGEIYNFKDLKVEFQNEHFQSDSDTEVLMKGLAQHGASYLSKLDGMFAFGFYDHRAKSLLLAVDPAGKKPIYTYWDGRRFAFASEIKALLCLEGGDFSIDHECVKESLIFGYVPYPHTIYRRIRKLPAGHFQLIDFAKGPAPVQQYWDVPLGQTRHTLSYADAKSELRHLVGRAVEKRLMSDVPLGSFLSGGLDSSIVALEAAKRVSPRKLKTFAAAFANDRLSHQYDESKFARAVAQRIGSDHHEIEIAAGAENAREIMSRFGDPFGDSSAIPTFLICREAKRHLSVVLSGDGGDELFGGYLRFRAALMSEKYKTLWQLLLSPMASPARWLGAKPRSAFGKMQRFQSALGRPLIERLALWNSFFSESDLESYLGEKTPGFDEQIRLWDDRTKGLQIGEKILYYNYKTYLFDDLLPKVDRMSMSHGLEVRSPLLDRDLTEFAFRLPTHFKFDAFSTKKILKDAYEEVLGSDIVHRRKQGFAFPLESFMSHQGVTTGTATRRLFPKAKLALDAGSSTNLTSKRFMLWSLETSLPTAD